MGTTPPFPLRKASLKCVSVSGRECMKVTSKKCVSLSRLSLLSGQVDSA